MKIPIKHLEEIADLDHRKLILNRKDPAIAAIYSIKGSEIIKTYTLSKEYLEILKDKNIKFVSVITNKKFSDYLREKHPDDYEKPTGSKPLSELITIAHQYSKMNRTSQKKRYIKIMQDLYTEGYSESSSSLIIESDTVIGDKGIEQLKIHAANYDKVDYIDSENGILVFNPDVQKIKIKVDLFAIISILGNYEIYDAQSIEEVLQIYKEKSPKLIILVDLEGNIQTKEALLEIEEFDPYVKKLDFSESPATNRQTESARILRSLTSDYKEVINSFSEEKEQLPPRIKNQLLNSVKALQVNWNKDDYIEKSFIIRKFGKSFNVKTILAILKNIRAMQ